MSSSGSNSSDSNENTNFRTPDMRIRTPSIIPRSPHPLASPASQDLLQASEVIMKLKNELEQERHRNQSMFNDLTNVRADLDKEGLKSRSLASERDTSVSQRDEKIHMLEEQVKTFKVCLFLLLELQLLSLIHSEWIAIWFFNSFSLPLFLFSFCFFVVCLGLFSFLQSSEERIRLQWQELQQQVDAQQEDATQTQNELASTKERLTALTDQLTTAHQQLSEAQSQNQASQNELRKLQQQSTERDQQFMKQISDKDQGLAESKEIIRGLVWWPMREHDTDRRREPAEGDINGLQREKPFQDIKPARQVEEEESGKSWCCPFRVLMLLSFSLSCPSIFPCAFCSLLFFVFACFLICAFVYFLISSVASLSAGACSCLGRRCKASLKTAFTDRRRSTHSLSSCYFRAVAEWSSTTTTHRRKSAIP